MEKRLLRPDEAASMLKISRWTVYRWISEGKLLATKIGPGSVRVFTESVESLVFSNKIDRQ